MTIVNNALWSDHYGLSQLNANWQKVASTFRPSGVKLMVEVCSYDHSTDQWYY